jgi:hypothetical protein
MALRSMASSWPSRADIGASMRLFRSLVVPSRASDVDWVVNTWVYGKMVDGMLTKKVPYWWLGQI